MFPKYFKPPGNHNSLLAIFLAALGYWSFAKLSGLLAIPPGYSTPIWPAAGFALIACVVYGPITLIGTFIGSILHNSSVSWLNNPELTPLLGNLVIATGSCLQAWVGTLILKRYVHFPMIVANIRQILYLYIYGGPLSCLVSTSIGNLTLYTINIIPAEQLLQSWLTWWIGDSIGVLLLAPIALVALDRSQRMDFQRIKPIVIPYVLVVSTLLGCFIYVRSIEAGKANNILAARSQLHAQTIERQLHSATLALENLSAFISATPNLHNEAFQVFTNNLLNSNQGIQAFEWIPKVDHQNREMFETKLQKLHSDIKTIRELSDQNTLITAQHRAEYYPVYYVNPIADNVTAIGFDVASETSRATALNQAKKEKASVSSNSIVLVQGSHHTNSFVVFNPVFSLYDDYQLRGFSLLVYHLDKILEPVLNPIISNGYQLTLIDITHPTHVTLYDNSNANPSPPLYSQTLSLNGRKWLLHLSASDQLLLSQQGWSIWMLLIMSMSFASLFSAFMLMVSGQRLAIRNQVLNKTQQLLAAKRVAEQANRQNHDFLANLSYQLRTQLHSAQGFTGRLNHLLPQTEDSHIQETLDHIFRSNQNMTQLANEIIKTVNCPLYKSGIEKNRVNLKDLLRELEPQIKMQLKDRPIDYNSYCSVDSIHADHSRLKQILIDLLDNACQYTRRGYIELSISKKTIDEQDGVEFLISDTGFGFSDDQQKQIMDNLYPNDQPQIAHKGLGLTVVKEFVDLHFGHFQINSTLGEGSHIYVWLPDLTTNNVEDMSPN